MLGVMSLLLGQVASSTTKGLLVPGQRIGRAALLAQMVRVGVRVVPIVILIQAALRTTMTFCSGLSTVVKHVNSPLCHNLQDMFVTLFLGLFDPSRNELAHVNTGHIQPLIMRHGERAQPFGKAANVPPGIFEGSF